MAEHEQLNIYQKLARIRKQVDVIRKNKKGYGYTYVSEEEILAKITVFMDKYNLSLIPGIVGGTTKVEPYTYKKTKSTKGGEFYEENVNEVLVSADMTWTWANTDNPDERVVVGWALVGQQSDASQAFGSGLTYSDRYFLLKYFNVATTDDDPDAHRSKQRAAEAAEDKMVAEQIISKFDGLVKAFLGTNEDNSIRRHHVLIRGALNDAVKKNIIPYNPADRVALPKKQKYVGSFYTKQQAVALLEAIKGTIIEGIVTMTVMGFTQQAAEDERKLIQKELDTAKARDRELDSLFERIYEDNVAGKLSDERFARMSVRYEDEQKELRSKIKTLQEGIERTRSKAVTADMFISSVRKYTRARKLTPRMLDELVQYIEVHQAEKVNGTWVQRLTIHYNCVGAISIPGALPLPVPDITVNTRKGVYVSYRPDMRAG